MRPPRRARPPSTASPRIPNTLFRFSKGHGGVACEGCHNSTHAIWPNPVDAHNDNVAAQQLQGHSGTVTECAACHGAGTLAAFARRAARDARRRRLALDATAITVRSRSRIRQACAACHGTTSAASPLSRTAAQRNWGSRTVAKGTAGRLLRLPQRPERRLIPRAVSRRAARLAGLFLAAARPALATAVATRRCGTIRAWTKPAPRSNSPAS